MGELLKYHITMLVTSGQELAIRMLFEEKSWHCHIKVLSEETVASIKQGGYEHAFPEMEESQNMETDVHAFKEVKTEVIDAYEEDTDSATDSYDETEQLKFSEVFPIKSVNTGVSTGNLDRHEGSTHSAAGLRLTGFTGFVCEKYRDAEHAKSQSPNMGHDSSNTVATSETHSGLDFRCVKLTKPGRTRSHAKYRALDDSVTANVPAGKMLQSKSSNNNFKSASGVIVSGVSGVSASFNEAAKTPLDCASISALNPSKKMDGVEHKRDKGKKDHDKQIEQHALPSNKSGDPYNGAYNFVSCIDCPSKFFSWDDLWKHRNEVQHELPAVKPHGWAKRNFSPEELQNMDFQLCIVCNNYFPNRRKLRQHYYALHRELMPAPSCPICGEDFPSHKELNKHKREQQHNDSLWLLKNYQCDTCGKHITKYENFKRHKLLFCGKSEEELEALRVHPCEVCGKRFKTLKEVKIHSNKVHDGTESVCDICGKLCKSKFSLRAHKHRHNEDNRKHACDECGKAFFTSSLLTQHIRIHTKEKPYKCPLCEYTCAHRVNVNKHIKNVHKQDLKAVDLRKPQSY